MISIQRRPHRNLFRNWGPALVSTAVVLAYLAVTATTALAHGEVITAEPTEAKSGETVTITGDDFPAGEEVELLLDGVRGTADLGHTEVNAAGTFEFVAEIPAGTAPGLYQLVAATEDDRVTVDFTVLAGGATGGGGETVLNFERSVAETVVIGILAVLATLVGGALVYSSRHRRVQG